MYKLGKLDTLDIILLVFIFLQVYWNWKQNRETTKELNKERTA